jgi:hypothetical protein
MLVGPTVPNPVILPCAVSAKAMLGAAKAAASTASSANFLIFYLRAMAAMPVSGPQLLRP